MSEQACMLYERHVHELHYHADPSTSILGVLLLCHGSEPSLDRLVNICHQSRESFHQIWRVEQAG